MGWINTVFGGRSSFRAIAIGAILGFAGLSALPTLARSQTAAPIIDNSYKIKVNFVIYLPVLMEREPQLPPREVIQIAVIGDSQIPPEFQRTNVTPNGHAIRFTSFASVDELQRAPSQPWRLVFLLKDTAAKIDARLRQLNEMFPARLPDGVEPTPEATSRRQVILVTEQDDKFRQTAALNFYEDQTKNRIRLQLRKSSLLERGLTPSKQLLAIDGVLAY